MTGVADPPAEAILVRLDPGPTEAEEIGVHRTVTFVAALGLLGVAFATWAEVVRIPATGALSVVAFAGILAVLALSLAARSQSALDRLDIALAVLGCVLVVGWAASTLALNPAYGTDEAAFEQYAAQLVVHGHDPYGANLLPALDRFRVPIQYATYLLNGGIVHGLGYPALSVLAVAAAVPLTGGTETVPAVDVFFVVATVAAMVAALPRPWKALGVLVPVGLPILFGYAISGVNAIILGFLLIPVAHRWSSVGRDGHLGRGGAARAAMFGLACATNQLAWFVAPFLLLGMWLLRRPDLGRRGAARIVGRYTAIAAGAFLATNLPFIIWGPAAWAHGMVAYLDDHAIPYGQGIIDASLFFHLGGGNLSLYTDAAALVYLGLLAVYGLFFHRLGRAAFIWPSVALFFPTRSLAEYFMTFVAVWTVAVITTGSAEFAASAQIRRLGLLRRPGLHGRRGAVLAAVTFVPAAACLAAALGDPPPLAITIRTVVTNGQLQAVWRIDATIVNRSGRSLDPHFAVDFIGQPTTFYNVLSGPRRLDPHESADYLLAAPNFGSMPGLTTPFDLQVVTDNPETVSTSALYTPQPYTAYLTPSAVDQVLPDGSQRRLTVALRNPLGASVRKAGVRVALGQLIYGQDALIPGEASINNQPEGKTPIYAYTGRDGTATFRVADRSPQGQPVYFQAWLQPPGSYPFGYSDIVPILWAGDPGK